MKITSLFALKAASTSASNIVRVLVSTSPADAAAAVVNIFNTMSSALRLANGDASLGVTVKCEVKWMLT